MNRQPAKKDIDAEIFKRTAQSSKVINLGIRHFRGGTRL